MQIVSSSSQAQAARKNLHSSRNLPDSFKHGRGCSVAFVKVTRSSNHGGGAKTYSSPSVLGTIIFIQRRFAYDLGQTSLLASRDLVFRQLGLRRRRGIRPSNLRRFRAEPN